MLPFRFRRAALPVAAATLALSGGVTALVPGAASAAPAVASVSSNAPTPPPGYSYRLIHSCGAPAAGTAACNAIVNELVDRQGKPAPAASSPGGYNPPDLQSAYNLPSSTAGTGQTVAIVDAYDDPNAESDLGVYRSQFGLPACTTANGCFQKVNQSGGTNYPRANGGWAQEESLDLDMVSAICPNCHILLVEASSASYVNLGTAVNEAATLGATEITNSYGGSESSGETSYDSYYNHPGVAVTVSSGDGGYGVEYPAASPYVTAVGGTSLQKASNSRGWTESVWSTSSTEGAGSGCSAYESQQSWQTKVTNITASPASCGNRAVADVSAVADPYTGVSVYDSYAYQGMSGWLVFGGTSVASPIIASVYALAGGAGGQTYGSYPYSHTSSLYDVTSGSTASCGSDLCTAATGWDGPTGLGTPDGAAAFGTGSGTNTGGGTTPLAAPVLTDTTSGNQVTLDWSTPSEPTGTTYTLTRGTTSLLTGTTLTSYTDTLAAGDAYTYQVTATDGTSTAQSNPLTCSASSSGNPHHPKTTISCQ